MVHKGKYGNNNKYHNEENIDDYDDDDNDNEDDDNNSDEGMEDFINDRFSSFLKHILSIKAN